MTIPLFILLIKCYWCFEWFRMASRFLSLCHSNKNPINKQHTHTHMQTLILTTPLIAPINLMNTFIIIIQPGWYCVLYMLHRLSQRFRTEKNSHFYCLYIMYMQKNVFVFGLATTLLFLFISSYFPSKWCLRPVNNKPWENTHIL